MSRLRKILVPVLVCGSFLWADEGMWMPHQIASLNLQKEGLEIDPSEIYSPEGKGLVNAVVYLGGGTGEFVSDQGLILTNHHVAFGALQRNSTPSNDLITNGFLARTKGDEIPAPGYIADVLLYYREVTSDVKDALKAARTPMERYKALDGIKKRLIAEEEGKGPDLRARFARMFSGNQYYLYVFKRLKDIRIVYAPPRDLGNFGGDTDNWMWPRHTADFSFLRAYVSKDNIGVEYSPENIPYHPEKYLTIAGDDLDEGDFTFILGYPGSTYRNDTEAELEFDMDILGKSIRHFESVIGFYEEASNKSPEIEIKYASKLKGLRNALKNYQGKLEGLTKHDIRDKKAAKEQDFLNWVRLDDKRNNRYGGILQEIQDFMTTYSNAYWKSRIISRFVSAYSGPALLSQAHLIVRTVEERAKPDMERDAYYQERNLPYIEQRIRLAEKSYDLDTDKEFFKFLLKGLLEAPSDQIPLPFREILKDSSRIRIDQFVESLYRGTSLQDTHTRLNLLTASPRDLKKRDDPLLELAMNLEEELKILREESKALGQQLSDLKQIYLEGLLQKRNYKLAPDANGTIRFTWGRLEGYSPRDAVYYYPQTSLTGVMEKNTGNFPFKVPSRLIELYNRDELSRYQDPDLGDIPVCFLNTTNVTGGNSGSPTLNARGELVGIVFDMTYESVVGDYFIIPEIQRTISVDIRYVLYLADKFSNAGYLLQELKIIP